MQNFIVRVACFMLLLNVLFSGWVGDLPASAATEKAVSTLINDDFTSYDDGTTAESLGYTYTAPATGTGTALVVPAPNGNGKGMYVSVSDGQAGTTAKISKTFETKQTGIVTVETSFMQPGPSKVKNYMLNLFNSNNIPVVRIGTDVSTSRGIVYFPNTATQAITSSYDVDTWYTVKVEVNTLTKKFSVWINGTLLVSRADADNNLDISRIEIGTPGNNGGEYIGKLMVTATPQNLPPDAPTGLYYVPRDKEIALFFDSVTSATYYNLKIKKNLDDPWYISSKYTSKKAPVEAGSVKNIAVGVPITNGQKYYVGVSQVTQDTRTLQFYESPETVIEATPYELIPVASAPSNIIGNLNVYDAYYASKWSVNTGIQSGDAPFSDKGYKITSLPAPYASMDWIKPSGNSQSYNTKPQIATFQVRDQASVYVAMDERATLPAWLAPSTGWTYTNDKINLSDGTYSYSLKMYKKDFPSGAQVTLGQNTVSQVTAGTNIGYFVLADRTPVGLQVDPLNPWVKQSTLAVTGSVYESSVTLSVYNNQSLVYSGLLTQNQFHIEVPLTPGTNHIEMYAARTNTTFSDKFTAEVQLDSAAPELLITTPPTSTKVSLFTLSGSVNEDSKVTVKNNGMVVYDSVAASVYAPFSYPIPLEEGSNHIEISAMDPAENVSTVDYFVNYTFWIEQPEYVGLAGEPLSALSPTKDTLAQRQVTNTTSKVKQVTLFFILYDQEGTMADYASIAAEFQPGETKTLSTGFILPDQVAGYTCKAYFWDNLRGMLPLSEPSSMQ